MYFRKIKIKIKETPKMPNVQKETKQYLKWMRNIAKVVHSGNFAALRYLYHKRRKINMNELNN